jgi:hypothetical protein
MSEISMKKTIKITPNLFNISGGDKTRKVRDKIQKPNKALIINPNILKKELINKIKKHINMQNINVSETLKKNMNDTNKTNNDNIEEFTDEFMDSIQYLNLLSKQKKDNEKNEFNKNKTSYENTQNKTLKNYNSQNHNDINFNTYVELDLPEELKDPHFKPYISSKNVRNTNINQFESGIKINYPDIQKFHTPKPNLNIELPYGCLKGGLKPTYRTWQATKKNPIF